MANDIVKISYQPLILVGHNVKPTTPITLDLIPGDSLWDDSSNILIGQTAYNVTDNKYYIRTDAGIELLKSTMYYEHEQGTSAAIWTITHNLGFRPSVIAMDSVYFNTVEGEIVHNSENELTIEFSGAFSGKAYLT